MLLALAVFLVKPESEVVKFTRVDRTSFRTLLMETQPVQYCGRHYIMVGNDSGHESLDC